MGDGCWRPLILNFELLEARLGALLPGVGPHGPRLRQSLLIVRRGAGRIRKPELQVATAAQRLRSEDSFLGMRREGLVEAFGPPPRGGGPPPRLVPLPH